MTTLIVGYFSFALLCAAAAILGVILSCAPKKTTWFQDAVWLLLFYALVSVVSVVAYGVGLVVRPWLTGVLR